MVRVALTHKGMVLVMCVATAVLVVVVSDTIGHVLPHKGITGPHKGIIGPHKGIIGPAYPPYKGLMGSEPMGPY